MTPPDHAQRAQRAQDEGRLSGWLRTQRVRAAVAYVPPGAHVLDVGCGAALTAGALPPGATYVGLDAAPPALAAARARGVRALAVADARATWPVAAASCDVVLLLAVLEHLPDPAAALAQARRVLRPGGRVITTTPAPLGRWPHELGARVGLFSREAADEHERFLGRADLLALGARADLTLRAYQRFLGGWNQCAVWTR